MPESSPFWPPGSILNSLQLIKINGKKKKMRVLFINFQPVTQVMIKAMVKGGALFHCAPYVTLLLQNQQ